MFIRLFSNLLLILLTYFGEPRQAPFNCTLPNQCRIDIVHAFRAFYAKQKTFWNKWNGIRCDLSSNSFRFDFEETQPPAKSERDCIIPNKLNVTTYRDHTLEIRWPYWSSWNRASSNVFILDRRFDFARLIDYTEYMKWFTRLSLINLRGLELQIIDNDEQSKFIFSRFIFRVACIHCTMRFFIDGKLIKSCDDILSAANASDRIMSIFQIRPRLADIFLSDVDFPQTVCPLVFANTLVSRLTILGLMQTFYRTSVLRFENRTLFDGFRSNIGAIILDVQNIKLDSSLLNPLVFQSTQVVYVRGFVSQLNGDFFREMSALKMINFQSIYFHKMIHKVGGIEWSKQINRHINVTNFSDPNSFDSSFLNDNGFLIQISCEPFAEEFTIANVFPNEDICIYRDFPFRQLAILIRICKQAVTASLMSNNNREFSCTYLWLIQYFERFAQVMNSSQGIELTDSFFDTLVSQSEEYRARRDTCEFTRRLAICDKSHFATRDFFGKNDWLVLNKILLVVFKIFTYVVSFAGLVTSFLVLATIFHKDNSDLFNQFKQYSYLNILSIFSVFILTIHLLSWTTECFYPFRVFCPKIRRTLFFQFFRIVVVECTNTTFQFMCNFCYVAFAFNRITLISKENCKLVKFFADVNTKKYICVCLILSVGASVIKYFKYEINFGKLSSHFPVSNEKDILIDSYHKASIDAFFIINMIVDLINYVLFVFVCVVIDVYTVIRLRSTLQEKTIKMALMLSQSAKTTETKTKENESVVEEVIKMVVLNTSVGVLLKMPACVLPIVSLYAEFYYKNLGFHYKHPAFGHFYSSLFDSEFFDAIQELSRLSFSVSHFAQFFIYRRFDKKFRLGFERLVSSTKKETTKLAAVNSIKRK